MGVDVWRMHGENNHKKIF